MPWLNELPISKSSLMLGLRSIRLSIPTRKSGCASSRGVCFVNLNVGADPRPMEMYDETEGDKD